MVYFSKKLVLATVLLTISLAQAQDYSVGSTIFYKAQKSVVTDIYEDKVCLHYSISGQNGVDLCDVLASDLILEEPVMEAFLLGTEVIYKPTQSTGKITFIGASMACVLLDNPVKGVEAEPCGVGIEDLTVSRPKPKKIVAAKHFEPGSRVLDVSSGTLGVFEGLTDGGQKACFLPDVPKTDGDKVCVLLYLLTESDRVTKEKLTFGSKVRYKAPEAKGEGSKGIVTYLSESSACVYFYSPRSDGVTNRCGVKLDTLTLR